MGPEPCSVQIQGVLQISLYCFGWGQSRQQGGEELLVRGWARSSSQLAQDHILMERRNLEQVMVTITDRGQYWLKDVQRIRIFVDQPTFAGCVKTGKDGWTSPVWLWCLATSNIHRSWIGWCQRRKDSGIIYENMAGLKGTVGLWTFQQYRKELLWSAINKPLQLG